MRKQNRKKRGTGEVKVNGPSATGDSRSRTSRSPTLANLTRGAIPLVEPAGHRAAGQFLGNRLLSGLAYPRPRTSPSSASVLQRAERRRRLVAPDPKKPWKREPVEVEVDLVERELDGRTVVVDQLLLQNRYVGDLLYPIHRYPPSRIEELEEILGRVRERINREYPDRAFEIGVKFDADVIKVVLGLLDEKEVTFSDLHPAPAGDDAARGEGLEGSVVTHTHPAGKPLSGGDVGKAAQFRLREVRAVGITVTSLSGADGGNIEGSGPKTKPGGEQAAYAPAEHAVRFTNARGSYAEGMKRWEGSRLDPKLSRSTHLSQWWGAATAATTYGWEYRDGTRKDNDGQNIAPYATKVLIEVDGESEDAAEEIVERAELAKLLPEKAPPRV